MTNSETEFANQDEEISYKDMWLKLKENLQSVIERQNNNYHEVKHDSDEARLICAKTGACQSVLDSMKFRENQSEEDRK